MMWKVSLFLNGNLLHIMLIVVNFSSLSTNKSWDTGKASRMLSMGLVAATLR